MSEIFQIETDQHWPTEPIGGTKRVLFMRHGESEFNIIHRINGNPRVPVALTERGREQARQAALLLRDEGIGAIVSSEFLRARQTAAIAAQVLGLPVVVHRLANEVRTDAHTEGISGREFYELIQSNPTTATIGAGGESFNDVLGRTQRLIDELMYASASTVLVVTHAWTLKSAWVLKGQATAHEAVAGGVRFGNCAVVDGHFDARGYSAD